ncbi:MAG: structural protein P5 [Alphaproteobacteria bacterium]|nr:structural protein P5 [Alphaproteobacteria bacterium]
MPSERAKLSRGYRNKNPGNIDWLPPGRAWNGQIGKEPGGRFGIYESHELGIRAIGKQLLKYQERDDLHTIRQMINRWAPPVENATNNYIARVDAMMTRHGADDRLNLREYLQLRVLVEAIIVVECGGNPYQPDVIDRGVRLALA